MEFTKMTRVNLKNRVQRNERAFTWIARLLVLIVMRNIRNRLKASIGSIRVFLFLTLKFIYSRCFNGFFKSRCLSLQNNQIDIWKWIKLAFNYLKKQLTGTAEEYGRIKNSPSSSVARCSLSVWWRTPFSTWTPFTWKIENKTIFNYYFKWIITQFRNY